MTKKLLWRIHIQVYDLKKPDEKTAVEKVESWIEKH